LARVRIINDKHVRCTLIAADGARIEGCAFRASDTPLGNLLLKAEGLPLHVAGHLRRDTWNGRDRVELVIEDAAAAGGHSP
jgi:single-stranded-DNA-specific exonuclease